MSENQLDVVYLGEEFPDIYFTKREVECLLYMLEGHTMVSAAELLGLSPRTVEFYVKNMRLKTGTNSKIDLIKKIRQMGFVEKLNLPIGKKRSELLKAAEPEIA